MDWFRRRRTCVLIGYEKYKGPLRGRGRPSPLCDGLATGAVSLVRPKGISESLWPRAAGSGAMAEAAGPSTALQGADRGAQRPVRAPRSGVEPSVLQVSQVVLRAIMAHKGLTLTALRKALGNAGYEVRRNLHRVCSSAAPGPEGSGAFLRVSGINSENCFRVWKTPKPRKKSGRQRLAEAGVSSRRSPTRPQNPRRRRTRRQAAKKAREVWRREAMLKLEAAKARQRARARARRQEARARASRQDPGPEPSDQKRSRSKFKEEKQEVQKPEADKADQSCSKPGKARTKSSTKSQGSRNAVGSP